MKALITGVNGQDGSYMSESLIRDGYEVYGMIRRASTDGLERLSGIIDDPKFHIVNGDITDTSRISYLVDKIKPDYIFHFAAQSNVGVSFDNPSYTVDTIVHGTLNILEAVREHDKSIKIYNAATSEMFGNEKNVNERGPFLPNSPYAAAKLCAFNMCNLYRRSYGLKVYSGITYNHESPRRHTDFVTRKVTMSVVMIASGINDELVLGNLNSSRDWGYAPEFINAMRLIMCGDPDDFVIATGKAHTVRELVDITFECAGITLSWSGSGLNEVATTNLVCGGYQSPNTTVVRVSPEYYRPTDVDALIGDTSKIRRTYGWEHRTSFHDMISMMVESDMKLVKSGNIPSMDKVERL